MRSTAVVTRAFSAVALIACLGTAPVLAGEVDHQEFSRVERGRYLATTSDCVSCHTVPNSGRPFAGGRPIETPFGDIVAPNITPDPATGIGAWSDDAFDAAVRRGIGRTGARLYPAMPYNAYTKMSRDDVLAIRAYLSTLQPIANSEIRPSLPFPFNIRSAMRVWNALYFTEGEYVADPQQSPAWNRGKFLVDGPAHCGACHTPKSMLGGDKTAQYLQGAYLQDWSAPDITNDARTGLGHWSIADIATYLNTGHNRMTAATGPMAEAVDLSFSKMTGDDVTAIATYLKSLPGRQNAPAPLSASAPAMVAGGAIYRDQCASCHGLDGKGIAQLFPSIAESAMVRSDDPTTVIRIVLRGARSVATDAEPTAPGMPSYAWQLTDTQIADVLTYMRNSWGGAAAEVTPAEVSRLKSALALRPD
jgi:mono/diheme cytochrome c family protein